MMLQEKQIVPQGIKPAQQPEKLNLGFRLQGMDIEEIKKILQEQKILISSAANTSSSSSSSFSVEKFDEEMARCYKRKRASIDRSNNNNSICSNQSKGFATITLDAVQKEKLRLVEKIFHETFDATERLPTDEEVGRSQALILQPTIITEKTQKYSNNGQTQLVLGFSMTGFGAEQDPKNQNQSIDNFQIINTSVLDQACRQYGCQNQDNYYIMCDQCKFWYHPECGIQGEVPSREEMEGEHFQFMCIQCQQYKPEHGKHQKIQKEKK